MKRKLLRTVFFLCIVLLGVYLQFEQEMEVISTETIKNGAFIEEHVTVILNKIYAADFQAYAEKIIQRCKKNDFEEIFFSYDSQIPNVLSGTVYLSKWHYKKERVLFCFCYEPNNSGSFDHILEKTETFRLYIEEVKKK